MKERWLQLWASVGHSGNPEALYEDLVVRYSEPHRAYHTLEHIRHCLLEYEAGQDSVDGPPRPQNKWAVQFALWYHDIFYDTHAQDNEERSAVYVQQVLTAAHAYFAAPELTASYVRVTAHNKEPLFLDEKIVLDIDLSILGQAPDVFDEYEKQVRFEYSWVPEDAFRSGRARILQAFLDRPNIYYTRYYHNKYEQTARENLQRSITAMV